MADCLAVCQSSCSGALSCHGGKTRGAGRGREVPEEPRCSSPGPWDLPRREDKHGRADTFEISAPATIWLQLREISEPDHPAKPLLNSCPQKL